MNKIAGWWMGGISCTSMWLKYICCCAHCCAHSKPDCSLVGKCAASFFLIEWPIKLKLRHNLQWFGIILLRIGFASIHKPPTQVNNQTYVVIKYVQHYIRCENMFHVNVTYWSSLTNTCKITIIVICIGKVICGNTIAPSNIDFFSKILRVFSTLFDCIMQRIFQQISENPFGVQVVLKVTFQNLKGILRIASLRDVALSAKCNFNCACFVCCVSLLLGTIVFWKCVLASALCAHGIFIECSICCSLFGCRGSKLCCHFAR